MSEQPSAELREMARLLTERNLVDERIARLFGRSVTNGALGEPCTPRQQPTPDP